LKRWKAGENHAYQLSIVVDLHHLSDSIADVNKLEKLYQRRNTIIDSMIGRLVQAHLVGSPKSPVSAI